MSCQDVELPSTNNKQVQVDNRSDVISKRKQKENCINDMKMHNFTECCRMWMCSHCSKSFASSRALKIHEVKQHENATRHVLKCGTCHEEFEHANLLHIHMRVHHNVKVRCPRCKDIFEHPSGLKLHIKAHHSEPVCVACGLKFDHDKLLRLHMEHYHKINGKGVKQNANRKGAKVIVQMNPTNDAVTGEACADGEHEDNGIAPRQSPGQMNGTASSGWEFHQVNDFDEEAMSNDSSDSRENGSTDGEAGDVDVDQGSDSEAAEIDNTREQHDFPLAAGMSESESSLVRVDSNCCEGVARGMDLKRASPGYRANNGCQEGVVRAMDEKSGISGLVVQSDSHEGVVREMDQKSSSSGFRTECEGVCKSSELRTETEYSEGDVTEKEPNLSPSFVERKDVPNQQQRSSVIVTTGRVSPVSPPRQYLKQIAEKPEQAFKESATATASPPDWDRASPNCSPHSLAASYTGSFPGSPASATSEGENGDSESTSHKSLAAKRVTLRCNRCQEEFVSKMEYLHHLISHQKADVSTTQSEFNPENDTIQKLKSSLRIKMEARRRDSLTDDGNQGFNTEKNACGETNNSMSGNHTLGAWNQTSLRIGTEDPSRSFTLACTLCSKEFPDMGELKAHMESRHKKPRCIECGLKFDHKNLLKIHMNSYHSSLEMLQCYHCSKSFANRSEFVTHVTSHETSLGKTMEIRGGHKPLRRISSAPIGGQSQNRISSEKQLFLRDNQNDVLSHGSDAKNRVNEKPTLIRSNHFKSPFDHLQTYCEQRFSPFGVLRQRREEPQEWFSKESANVLVGPEARTRIFLPKRHGAIEPDPQLVSGQKQREAEDLTRHSPAGSESDRDSFTKRLTTRLEAVKHPLSAFTAYERTDCPNELSKHMSQGRARIEREALPLCRPPPLIPVVHPRLSGGFTRQSGTAVLRAHQPVTRTASANSALSNPRVLPYPALSSLKLHRAVRGGPVRESTREVPREPREKRPQEPATRENINNITKEALLNSLSLKRRASAPELGTLARPLAEPQRSVVPELSTLKNVLSDSGHTSENSESTLASPPRQPNESYQPRRKHQHDFTCHHCGISFGHKKLLKIHLDCYHGSAQDLQCLRCEKNFPSRSEFLEHLMSHEGGDELLAFQRKRLRLDRRASLPHGETVIRRELNMNVFQTTSFPKEKAEQRGRELANHQGRFQHPLKGELSQREDEKTHEYSHPENTDVKRECEISGVKSNTEKNNEDDGANFCFVCGQSFSNGKKLEQHISSHAVVDKNGRYCCSLCHKTFDHHRKLEIHTRSHTGFKPHKCELCGRCFPYYSSYYYHKMTHTEDRPHKCEICGKGFIQTRYLRSHMKTHKGQDGWASDEEVNVENFPDQIKTSDSAETTSKSPRGDTETMVKVERLNQEDVAVSSRALEEQDTARILCSFKTSSSIALPEQRSPSDVRPVDSTREEPSCAEESQSLDKPGETNRCQVSVSNSDADCADRIQVVETAVENLTSSSNESLPKVKKKKYKCKHCEKNFSSYSSLHVHVRIHTGQRPYSCNHCFKKFTHSSGLKRHVRCHTGEKPYPCPACPSAFADRGALKSHIRTHTGERPFVCDLCNKTFTQPSSLRVHKKTVHANEFFS